jgi:sulfur carrier protein ThiS
MRPRGSRADQRVRLAVVEFEIGPQLESPGQAVVRDLLRFDHLALRLELLIEAVERVPNHRRGVADHILRAPDRIEIGEVRLRHEAERPRRRALRERRCRKAARPGEHARRADAFE